MMSKKNPESSSLFPTLFLIVSVILIITIGYFSGSPGKDKTQEHETISKVHPDFVNFGFRDLPSI